MRNFIVIISVFIIAVALISCDADNGYMDSSFDDGYGDLVESDGQDIEDDSSEELNEESEDIESSPAESNWIVMPNDSDTYVGIQWTLEELIAHFNELGFYNIEAVPCKPDNDTYRYNIMSIHITTGSGWLANSTSWKQGEEFSANDLIRIGYNSEPMLTKDNCSDFANVLNGQSMTWQEFVEKYDGRYVDFIGYVVHYDPYWGGAVIEVVGSSYVNTGIKGLTINLQTHTWGYFIEDGIKEGSVVWVNGMVDREMSEFYKEICIETRFAYLR